jgi:membrane protease YdiL (CAAX protease family)
MSSDPVPPPSPQEPVLPQTGTEPRKTEGEAGNVELPLSPIEIRALEGLLDVLPADIEDLPFALAVDTKPQPGFWLSALSCVAFLIVLYGTLFLTSIVVLIGKAVVSGDPNAFFSKALATGTNKNETIDNRESETLPRIVLTPDLISSMAYGTLIAEIVSILVAWLVVRLVVGREWPRRLAVRRPGGVHTILAILSWPALLIIPGPISELARQILPTLLIGDKKQAAEDIFGQFPLWLAIFAIGVGPGIGEELWCRGFLGRGLVARYGVVGGILLTSFFFGLLHVDPAYAMVTACMGIWLHYVYWTTRSLWLSMLLHFLNNTTGVLLSHFGTQDSSDQTPVIMPVVATLLMAAIGWALYSSRSRLAPGSGSPGSTWLPAYPSVEYPPKGSGVRVVRPWPSWPAAASVLLSVALFSAVAYSIFKPIVPWR